MSNPLNNKNKKFNLKISLMCKLATWASLLRRTNLFKVRSNLKKISKLSFQVELVKVLNQNLNQQEEEVAVVELQQEV